MDRATQVVERLKGPVVPLNICFNEDGTVNYGAVQDYVKWLCEQKVPILMLTAGSSEFASLVEEEIWQLTAAVGEANAGRSAFIAGTGYWKPSKTREFLVHADAVGADTVMVQFHPQGPETVLRYFDLLEGASDIPLILLLGGTKQFPLTVTIELAQRPYIVGAKNDGHPFYDYYDLIRKTRDEDFAVISGGQMRNFVFGYQVGSPAYLCTIAPFRPDIALQFYHLLVERRYDEAWQMVFRYEEPLVQWAIDHNWLAVMKSAVQLQGLYPNNWPCPPNPTPPPGLIDEVQTKLEEIFGVR